MNNLNKIINLVKKTGDKMVVTDQNGEESFVIMPLSDYEKIIENRTDYKSMSEKELFDSVERDIALWRAEHESFGEAQDFRDYEDYDRYGDYDELESEPWETEREPWENEPLPFSDEEPLPWEEDEEIEEIKDIKGNKVDKFSIPEERFEGEERSEPIKYEDIPPPPDVNIEDVLADSEKKEEIIDMSFEEEGEDFAAEDDEDDDFMEESVF